MKTFRVKSFRYEPKNRQGVHSFSNFSRWHRSKKYEDRWSSMKYCPIHARKLPFSFHCGLYQFFWMVTKKNSQIWEKGKALLNIKECFRNTRWENMDIDFPEVSPHLLGCSLGYTQALIKCKTSLGDTDYLSTGGETNKVTVMFLAAYIYRPFPGSLLEEARKIFCSSSPYFQIPRFPN